MTTPKSPEEVAKDLLPAHSTHYPILEATLRDGSKRTIKAFFVEDLEKNIAQALRTQAQEYEAEIAERSACCPNHVAFERGCYGCVYKCLNVCEAEIARKDERIKELEALLEEAKEALIKIRGSEMSGYPWGDVRDIANEMLQKLNHRP